MKCTRCGYQESVPKWILEEMAEVDGKPDDLQMLCPKCSRAPMYPINSNHFNK